METLLSLKTEVFKKFLKKKGVTIEAVAEKLDMSRQNFHALSKKEYFKTELSNKLVSIYGSELLEANENESVNENVKESVKYIPIDKLIEVMEENRNLWKIIASNGIKIPANFSLVGGYATVYVGLFLCLY